MTAHRTAASTAASRDAQPHPEVERAPRWRLVVFWVLCALVVVGHLGERPQQLHFPITAFGDGVEGGHEMHFFTKGAFLWAVLAAVASSLRRPMRKVGAAWVYGLGTVVAFGGLLAFAAVPPEVTVILAVGIAVGMLAFLAHPASLRSKLIPPGRPDAVLLGLVAVAAVPLVAYAVGQLDIHAASGPADQHHEFGHWVVMAVYAVVAVLWGLGAALRLDGWRVPLWAAGLLVAGLGVASLGISAVSQLGTPWALAAVVWGGAFIATGELRSRAPSRNVGRP